MNYLKIVLYVGLFIIGFGCAWAWQGARLDAVKTEYQVCKDANAENNATIDALKAEIGKGNKACEARLKSKDAVIKRLKVIDGLSGGKHEKTHSDSGDPILDELDRMWDSH